VSLSYFQIDDYLTCPLKYKFVHLLHSPVMRHHAVIYGKALHDAVQEYYRRKLQGYSVTEDDLIAVFKGSWVSEGFLSREHEEQRFEEGCRVLRQFFVEQERLDRLPSYIEKEFSFRVGRNRVIGRWDRVDLTDDEVVIIDFKSSDVRAQRKADEETQRSLQLSIYALAYKQIFDRIPDRVELHFLESGLIGQAVKTEEELRETISKIEEAAAGIRARRYHAQPDYWKCQHCVCSSVCPETLTVI
jgi:DNA helicase-2/ATP-dependent DNA helicase PcrA